MKRFTKIFSICFMLSILSIFQSCGPTESAGIRDFEIDEIRVRNLDNSNEYLSYNASNTMHKNAVAFEIDLYDSRMYGSQASCTDFIINSCQAYSPIEPMYKPVHAIRKISIVTLADFSPTLPANTDVSDTFLVLPEEPRTGDYLYRTLADFYTLVHDKVSSYPQIRFSLVCQERIENTSAQFRITVEFDNNTNLAIDTENIELIDTNE